MAEQHKVCPTCGRNNPPAARFCAGCGSSLQRAPLEAERVSSTPQVGPAPEPAVASQKKTRFFFVAASGILVVVAAVIILVQRFTEVPPATQENGSTSGAEGAAVAGTREAVFAENSTTAATEMPPELTASSATVPGTVQTLEPETAQDNPEFLIAAVASFKNGERPERRELVLLEPDRVEPYCVTYRTFAGSFIGTVEWSPHRDQLLYGAQRRLYLLTPASSQPLALGGANDDAGPATWSPDGTRIAYVSRQDDSPELWVMEADGSAPRRLLENPFGDYLSQLHWSPSGNLIAFVRSPEGAEASNLYVVGNDGSDPRQLTSGNGYLHSVAWAPDGKRIAYLESVEKPEGWMRVVSVVSVDSTERQVIYESPTSVYPAAWSPDGRMLAFWERGEDDRPPRVVLLSLTEAAEVERFVDFQGSPSPVEVTWSMDGSQIYAFTGENGIWLNAASVETGEVRRLWHTRYVLLSPARIIWSPAFDPENLELVDLRQCEEDPEAASWQSATHTVFRSGDGQYVLWLQTEAGEVFLARSGTDKVWPLAQVNDIEIGPLDDEGIPTYIAGYERLARGQTLRYLGELTREFDSSSVHVANLDETWINVIAESDN